MNPKFRAYFELLRFPAVFTALADVMMGFVVTRGDLRPFPVFLSLAATSACLYLAGMVLNDVVDIETDTQERPHRPIPSGRVPRRAAARLAACLLIGGLGFAAVASGLLGHCPPLVISILLATAVVLYDTRMKTTPAAPVAMGSCRFFNVLLGMSAATASRWPFGPNWEPFEIAIALGIGIYVVGLTVFAAGEARAPRRSRLLAGILIMLSGFLVLEQSAYMKLRPADAFAESEKWPVLWLLLATVILGRFAWAAWRLEPRATQIAVRSGIRALIFIDAALAFGYGSPTWGWYVLALLVPMLLLERWASTT